MEGKFEGDKLEKEKIIFVKHMCATLELRFGILDPMAHNASSPFAVR